MDSWDYWSFLILIGVGFYAVGRELQKIADILRDIRQALADRVRQF